MSKKYESAAELEILVQALQQQIQRMQTRMKQEEESYKNKEQHMQAEISKYRHIEEKARGLCVLILGKDRGEMVLGQDYTWNKIDTEGLIEKATTSYKQYCDARKQDLQRIHISYSLPIPPDCCWINFSGDHSIRFCKSTFSTWVPSFATTSVICMKLLYIVSLYM